MALQPKTPTPGLLYIPGPAHYPKTPAISSSNDGYPLNVSAESKMAASHDGHLTHNGPAMPLLWGAEPESTRRDPCLVREMPH